MRIFINLVFISLISSGLFAAPSREQKKILRLENEIKELRGEIGELKASIDSLNSLSERITENLRVEEDGFKRRLSRVIIHLMQWPERRWGRNVGSWIELQRANLVLESVRQRLVQSPLRLIADREIRLEEVERLKSELTSQMSELEAKQALLDFQLGELRNLERRMKKKIPHATGASKKVPGNAEPVK